MLKVDCIKSENNIALEREFKKSLQIRLLKFKKKYCVKML